MIYLLLSNWLSLRARSCTRRQRRLCRSMKPSRKVRTKQLISRYMPQLMIDHHLGKTKAVSTQSHTRITLVQIRAANRDNRHRTRRYHKDWPWWHQLQVVQEEKGWASMVGENILWCYVFNWSCDEWWERAPQIHSYVWRSAVWNCEYRVCKGLIWVRHQMILYWKSPLH
jgi:hypothetical protein